MRGPEDLRYLGRRLDWLRRRLEEFETQKNRFLRIRLKGTTPVGTGHGPLHQAISRLLRDNAFEISWVDEIPLTSRGKLLQVVQEGDESAGAR